jgi:hypothetical protein
MQEIECPALAGGFFVYAIKLPRMLKLHHYRAKGNRDLCYPRSENPDRGHPAFQREELRRSLKAPQRKLPGKSPKLPKMMKAESSLP